MHEYKAGAQQMYEHKAGAPAHRPRAHYNYASNDLAMSLFVARTHKQYLFAVLAYHDGCTEAIVDPLERAVGPFLTGL